MIHALNCEEVPFVENPPMPDGLVRQRLVRILLHLTQAPKGFALPCYALRLLLSAASFLLLSGACFGSLFPPWFF
jgi:hypothetical protein